MLGLQAAGAPTVVVNVRVRLCARPAAAHLPLPLLARDRNNGIPGAVSTQRQIEPPQCSGPAEIAVEKKQQQQQQAHTQ